jgi:hypothetical protein
METEGSLPCSRKPPVVPIMSQMNPLHTTLSCLFKIHLNISTHLDLGLHSDLIYSGFLANILYTFLVSHVRATYPAHFILLDLIILIILGEEQK